MPGMSRSELVAMRFNEMINARDLDGLGTLMTDDHTFVDAAGQAVVGRTACLAAWRGFFAGFPSYRNEFESVRSSGETVVITGRSHCAELTELAGPALWTAETEGDLVRVWQVYEDTRAARHRLGIGATAP